MTLTGRPATITLRGTKGRREDVMPLPAATGHAIANYLKYERPPTSNRAVFVRNIAPRDQLIGPDLIRKTIRQLMHERFALHTVASSAAYHGQSLTGRCSSLKEVAMS